MQGLRGGIHWETGNFLRKRGTIHNHQIRDLRTRMLRVSEHIDNCANNLSAKYYTFPFYKMYTESTSLRRTKESVFINKLNPKLSQSKLRKKKVTILITVQKTNKKNLKYYHYTKCKRNITSRKMKENYFIHIFKPMLNKHI